MTKLATIAVCGLTFALAFIAYSVGRNKVDFWRWSLEKEAGSRTKNKCMIAFLVNDAYRRGRYGDVVAAYSLFKDTIDAIDGKGRLREKITRSNRLVGLGDEGPSN